jgi:hypothetical protein
MVCINPINDLRRVSKKKQVHVVLQLIVLNPANKVLFVMLEFLCCYG